MCNEWASTGEQSQIIMSQACYEVNLYMPLRLVASV